MKYPGDPRRSELFGVALRTISGLLGTRHRSDPESAKLLLSAYQYEARRLRLPVQDAWAVLFQAGLHISYEMAEALSAATDTDQADVLGAIGLRAAAYELVTDG